MRRTLRVGSLAVFTAALLAYMMLSLPLAVSAQTAQDQLRATIRAEILSDPRTSTLTSAQLGAMVELLAQSAEREGITASEITYRPQSLQNIPTSPEFADICGDTPAALCVFSRAFGFLGPAYVIPFTLGAASMGLVWILAEMIHRRRHPAFYEEPQSPVAPSA
ncbi:MAG: type II secretion system protein M [Patescibacteria group bacterium]|nr:type II secretion system protein M [Patescibacteria group bacterium]